MPVLCVCVTLCTVFSWRSICPSNVSLPPIVAHPPVVPWWRKPSPECDTQDHPPAKTVARLTYGETVGEVVSVPLSRLVSSSAPVVIGGVVAAEKSPPVCEGEQCGVSSPSVRLGWNTIL